MQRPDIFLSIIDSGRRGDGLTDQLTRVGPDMLLDIVDSGRRGKLLFIHSFILDK